MRMNEVMCGGGAKAAQVDISEIGEWPYVRHPPMAARHRVAAASVFRWTRISQHGVQAGSRGDVRLKNRSFRERKSDRRSGHGEILHRYRRR